MKTILSAAIVGLMLIAPVALHADPPPHAAAWEHKKHYKEREREARKWERERARELRKWQREREHDAYYHRHERHRYEEYRLRRDDYHSKSHDHYRRSGSSLRIYLEF